MRKEHAMGCFVKGAVRFGVMAALAGGAAAIVAEAARPGSVGAILHQTSGAVGSVIDANIDDPAAMRSQIKRLQAEYPEKIAEVRSDLNEVRDQMSQLERERDVSAKVVELTANDLSLIETGLQRAQAAQSAHQGAVVRISFNEARLSPNEAMARRSDIAQTRSVYQSRVAEVETELGFLADQEAQLAELLVRLETEQAEFEAQLFQLDAQIDSIARNDRLIEMMEDRQATIDEHNRYQAHSLDQLRGRLDRIRNEQTSRIAQIGRRDNDRNYVAEAEFLADQEASVRLLIEPGESFGEAIEVPSSNSIQWEQPEVIEIDPEAEEADGQVASNG
jgi:chromosome segregation ATPase